MSQEELRQIPQELIKVSKAQWTPEEEALLEQKINEYKSDWEKIQQDIPYRSVLEIKCHYKALQYLKANPQKSQKSSKSLNEILLLS